MKKIYRTTKLYAYDNYHIIHIIIQTFITRKINKLQKYTSKFRLFGTFFCIKSREVFLSLAKISIRSSVRVKTGKSV